MGYDVKYGRITTENKVIPDDEPVFLLRAQDTTALETLGHYLDVCGRAGADAPHIAIILEVITLFGRWQRDHAAQVKVPDS